MTTLGIAGLGYIGRIHLEASRQVPDLQVAAVASSRPEEVRRTFPGVRVYPACSELLNHSEVDGVVICLPTFLHERYVMEALEKGLHVLCEKPMALDAGAADRMLDASKRCRRVLMVAQVLRFWPQYIRIKELVEDGALGSIRSVAAYRLGRFPAWSEWFRDPAKSGGCLLDLQVHDVDFVHWLLGSPAAVNTAGTQSILGSWDHVFTTLTYPHAVATIEASYLMPDAWPFSSGIRVHGSDGCVEYTFRVGLNIKEREQASHQFRLYKAGGQVSEPTITAVDPFVAQLCYFVKSVNQEEPPRVCPPEESRDVMKVMAASRLSAETRRIVALDGSSSKSNQEIP